MSYDAILLHAYPIADEYGNMPLGENEFQLLTSVTFKKGEIRHLTTKGNEAALTENPGATKCMVTGEFKNGDYVRIVSIKERFDYSKPRGKKDSLEDVFYQLGHTHYCEA